MKTHLHSDSVHSREDSGQLSSEKNLFLPRPLLYSAQQQGKNAYLQNPF